MMNFLAASAKLVLARLLQLVNKVIHKLAHRKQGKFPQTWPALALAL